jgi:hypothetical protein
LRCIRLNAEPTATDASPVTILPSGSSNPVNPSELIASSRASRSILGSVYPASALR